MSLVGVRLLSRCLDSLSSAPPGHYNSGLSSMHFHLITIFPEFFASPLMVSLIKKAQEKGIVSCTVHNLRDYAAGAHRSTDDSPYGGSHANAIEPHPSMNAPEQS